MSRLHGGVAEDRAVGDLGRRDAVPFIPILSLAAVAMAALAVFGEGWPDPLTVVGALAGLVPWALVTLGVRVPLDVFTASGVAAGLLIVVVDTNAGGMFPLMMLVVLVVRSTDDRLLVAGTLIVSCAAIVALAVLQSSVHESGLPYFLGGVGISALSGRMLRTQRLLVDELRTLHARSSEHAAAAERTRIAREVHDVVAHSLTVVMLHLTGARRALATDPARADEALARAESVGRESLDSIRQVVGLLRTGDPGEGRRPDEPLPGVAELDDLVEGYRVGGLAVTTEIELDGVDIDRAVQLVAYRVVQESLSNALQHAPGCACSVQVRARPGRGIASLPTVEVVVENSTPPAGVATHLSSGRPASSRAGLGVRGMRERVVAAGGSLVAGERPAGGWRVAASLPLRPATVSWPARATQPTVT